jgi:hypothetical protein
MPLATHSPVGTSAEWPEDFVFNFNTQKTPISFPPCPTIYEATLRPFCDPSSEGSPYGPLRD